MEARELADAIRRRATRGVHGRWLRGQRHAAGGAAPLRAFHKPDAQEEERYSPRGDPALYFSAHLEGVEVECPPTRERPELAVVAFQLELPDVLELRWVDDGSPLARFWAHADRAADERGDYAATHVLRDACRLVGVDAIRYGTKEERRRGTGGVSNLALLGAAARRVAGMRAETVCGSVKTPDPS